MVAGLNAIVDISHHNGPSVNFAGLKAGGIVGVIHKATQGQSTTDKRYKTNKAKAAKAGLMWGAYHFGTGSDGVKQASNFLDTVGDVKHTLLVLDLEPNPTGPSMSLTEAHAFVTHVQAKTGRYPGLYSGHYIKQLLGANKDPILAQCWLWLAQYGPTPVVPHNWATWTMWQYTDGNMGPAPHDVTGVKGNFDRDTFNGTLAQLQSLWG